MRGWKVLLFLMVLLLPVSVRAQDRTPLALVLSAKGALTPAMREYIARGIQIAEQRGAEMIILQLDTPGGSIELMNNIVQDIRASRTPVIVYIAPNGAIAGSAGTVITLAGHAAAMAPETAIGAASPVGAEGQELGETMEAKAKNILSATVRSLAERRGPEAARLADETIQNALAVSSSEALQAGLIDFIAVDVYDLLRQLNGFTVQTTEGEITLNTAGLRIEPLNPTLIEQILGMLTNPTIVFLLLFVGVQSILIELSSPGGWVAGFIGVVCLALAAYGLGVLPVNWFGIIFIVLAFALFILELKTPTQGALTVAGVVSLIVGAMVLFNSNPMPGAPRVPVPLIIGVSAATGGIFFFMTLFAMRAQRTPHRMGQESLVGRYGVAHGELSPRGIVQLGGEQWTAELLDGEEHVSSGERVEVVAVEGIKLRVRKAPK